MRKIVNALSSWMYTGALGIDQMLIAMSGHDHETYLLEFFKLLNGNYYGPCIQVRCPDISDITLSVPHIRKVPNWYSC